MAMSSGGLKTARSSSTTWYAQANFVLMARSALPYCLWTGLPIPIECVRPATDPSGAHVVLLARQRGCPTMHVV